jgi:hypothetical protein
MALTFPLATNVFADVIDMMQIRFRLSDALNISGNGRGQLIVADLAPKYWEADVTVATMENDRAVQVQALVEGLDGGINDFYFYDPRCAYPQYDPDGSSIISKTIRIETLHSNNKQMTLKQLPTGFQVKAGDMLAFDYGPDDNYRALHRVVSGATAAADGTTGSFEVRPFIQPGAALNAIVSLIKPAARMKLVPDSFDPGTSRQNVTRGMTFKCRQVP